MLKQAWKINKMDLPTGQARFTTTIQIPMWLRRDIKLAGFTINGAMIAGWEAIQKQKVENQEIKEVMINMEKYRSAYLRLKDRVEELEKLD